MKAIKRFKEIQKAHNNLEVIYYDDIEFLIWYINQILGILDNINNISSHLELKAK